MTTAVNAEMGDHLGLLQLLSPWMGCLAASHSGLVSYTNNKRSAYVTAHTALSQGM
jgi:hypothetical protein